jgi:hypothetical protein
MSWGRHRPGWSTLSIELIQASETPPMVLLRWPVKPSVAERGRFAATASAITQLASDGGGPASRDPSSAAVTNPTQGKVVDQTARLRCRRIRRKKPLVMPRQRRPAARGADWSRRSVGIAWIAADRSSTDVARSNAITVGSNRMRSVLATRVATAASSSCRGDLGDPQLRLVAVLALVLRFLLLPRRRLRPAARRHHRGQHGRLG